MTVWKNARKLGETAGAAATELASGVAAAKVPGAEPYTTPSGLNQAAILLQPIAITRDNLNLVIDARWTSKAAICQGVTKNPPPACK